MSPKEFDTDLFKSFKPDKDPNKTLYRQYSASQQQNQQDWLTNSESVFVGRRRINATWGRYGEIDKQMPFSAHPPPRRHH